MPRPLGKITPLARFFGLVAKAQRCLKRQTNHGGSRGRYRPT